MRLDNNYKAFFEFLRVGLWEDLKVKSDGLMVKTLPLAFSAFIDWKDIYRIADEQSVVGLVAAGIDWIKAHDPEFTIQKNDLFQFVGYTLQLEQRNRSINESLTWIVEKLREEDVFALLVKGQGIAQCYEKPLWRASGDIDLLLDADRYERAKDVLLPLARDVEREYVSLKHQGMTINGVVIELHGTLHSRLSKRIDREIDAIQVDCFMNKRVRGWHCGKTDVFLPAANNDVIFVFTHILHHFFIEGVGLRQICDWCRLLWTYRDEIDKPLLEQRLKRMGLMSEWKAFAALAVDWLGMPMEAMPFYCMKDRKFKRYQKKGDRLMEFVLKSGNMGHKRRPKRSKHFIISKMQAAWYKMRDFGRIALVFPCDSVKFFWHFVWNGVGLVVETV